MKLYNLLIPAYSHDFPSKLPFSIQCRTVTATILLFRIFLFEQSKKTLLYKRLRLL